MKLHVLVLKRLEKKLNLPINMHVILIFSYFFANGVTRTKVIDQTRSLYFHFQGHCGNGKGQTRLSTPQLYSGFTN